jgi:hypothetical protein
MGFMITHKNTTQSRMVVVNLSEINVIPGVESVLWKYIWFEKHVRLYIACGNLMVNVCQQHNL